MSSASVANRSRRSPGSAPPSGTAPPVVPARDAAPAPSATTLTESVPPSSPRVPELPELLRMFNEVSSRLSETHRRLEERVAGLQRELAEAHEGLRRSRALAALGEMAAGIAHEVRNPLASIALHAEVLREDLADRPAELEILAKIAGAVARLDSIVTDVLRFARTGGARPVRTEVRAIVEEAIASCRAEIDQASVDLRLRIPASLEVVADPASLTQALINVLRNAVEAIVDSAAPKRRVRIEAAEQPRLGPDGRRAMFTVIAVEDSGPGLDPSIADRVFTPFVTTRAAGTGLGLAIVHRILDAHGGAVSISRRSRSGGARVELALPSMVPWPCGSDREPEVGSAPTGAAPRGIVHAAVEDRLVRVRGAPGGGRGRDGRSDSWDA